MVRTVVSAAVKADISKYEEAVKTLNTLQTNAQTLEKIRQERDKRAHLNIPRMWMFAERLGIQEKDVDRLNVIHVSGTKGKGSTCAFCESLLRHHGYRTGFFSSPHLVEVRERFSINGVALGREKFASYFWEVYNRLDKTKSEHEETMPNYFGFLTVMALHVFLQEGVDVAILEVGIGGQYDCTNMVRHPLVCGVSSLGLDHTSILGTSIDKIAWHKAGIFKPGVAAFTVPQCPAAMSVLKDRAQEIGAPLAVCPDISAYGPDIKLGIKGSVQALNASLGLQLFHTWIQKHKEKSGKDTLLPGADVDKQNKIIETYCDIKMAAPFHLTQQHLSGLAQCQWLGRNQTVREPGITYYLDGAHTLESIEQCVEWFRDESKLEKSQSKHGIYRVLIYNTTGDRETSSLLKPLLCCDFDAVLFCPNIAYEKAMSADQTNNTVTKENQQKRCMMNKETWELLSSSQQKQTEISKLDSSCNERDHISTNGHAETSRVENGMHSSSGRCELHVLSSISECMNWVCKGHWTSAENSSLSGKCVNGEVNGHVVSNGCDKMNICDIDNGGDKLEHVNGSAGLNIKDEKLGNFINQHVQVLVTGSMHLVGGALRVLWDRQS